MQGVRVAMNGGSPLRVWLAVGVLWLWLDRACGGLVERTMPEVLYAFGSDQGDSVVALGDDNCQGPIDMVDVFASSTLFVSASSQHAIKRL